VLLKHPISPQHQEDKIVYFQHSRLKAAVEVIMKEPVVKEALLVQEVLEPVQVIIHHVTANQV
jgi:hypothetical protein